MTTTTIVGGGIAGLVAAIELAEAGAQVLLHEAGPRSGGRARTEPGPYRANRGPHALYLHGGFAAWLRQRGLLPPLVAPRLLRFRLLHRGRLLRLPLPLLPMQRLAGRDAPVESDYRSWAASHIGEAAAEAAIGFASLPCFHGDPGALAAAFVQERIRRSSARGAVGYVVGGWERLVEALVARAGKLGVGIETGSRLTSLPEGPSIVATDLPAAARLLGDASLDWPGPRTAVLDVALARRRRDPSAVLDLDRRVWVSRYSASDASLAPPGEDLLQASAGLRAGEGIAEGLERIRSVLDRGFPGWRERARWERHGLFDGGAGAADPPGSCWRDRPAVERGDGVWLAGDRVAAPGMLAEVACESARRAARRAAAALRPRRRAAASTMA